MNAGSNQPAPRTAAAAEPTRVGAVRLLPQHQHDPRARSSPLVEVIDIAAKAGYDGIEPWIDEIDDVT